MIEGRVVSVPTLLARRRTGLVLGVVVLACSIGFLLFLTSDADHDSPWALLGLGALVCLPVCLASLRASWEDSDMRDDAQVVRLGRLAWATRTAYSLALVPSAVFVVDSDAAETLDWLEPLSGILVTVAAALVAVTLAAAARWSPGRR